MHLRLEPGARRLEVDAAKTLFNPIKAFFPARVVGVGAKSSRNHRRRDDLARAAAAAAAMPSPNAQLAATSRRR